VQHLSAVAQPAFPGLERRAAGPIDDVH
jgi:hypothetical protein